MKKMTDEQKKNIVTASSVSVGSAAGIIAGMAGVQVAEAAEVNNEAAEAAEAAEQEAAQAAAKSAAKPAPTEQAEKPTPKPEPQQESEPQPEPAQEPQPATKPETETQPQSQSTSEPLQQPTPETESDFEEGTVEILGVETVTDESGQQAEIAVTRIDENVVIFADLDMDDNIDQVAVDANQNEAIEEDEIFDVSDQGMSMTPLREAAQAMQPEAAPAVADPMDNQMAMNEYEGPDYMNDANAADFIA